MAIIKTTDHSKNRLSVQFLNGNTKLDFFLYIFSFLIKRLSLADNTKKSGFLMAPEFWHLVTVYFDRKNFAISKFQGGKLASHDPLADAHGQQDHVAYLVSW